MKGVKQLEVPLRQLAKRGTKLTSVEICCGSSAPAKRDYAMRASLFGCGLRRSELVRLKVVEIQRRQDHWVVADLRGKGEHICTMPVMDWVKVSLDP